jgi:hypothetical protein
MYLQLVESECDHMVILITQILLILWLMVTVIIQMLVFFERNPWIACSKLY